MSGVRGRGQTEFLSPALPFGPNKQNYVIFQKLCDNNKFQKENSILNIKVLEILFQLTQGSFIQESRT